MHFWNVTVQLDREYPEETMTFVFPSDQTTSAIMRKYMRLFPGHCTINVHPCDAWGRKRRAAVGLCPTCGQPVEEDEPCSHRRQTDHYCIRSGGKAI